MKSLNRTLAVAMAACLMLAGAEVAEARGGGFAGGGPRFVPHAPYVGNGYFGRSGRPVGRTFGGRRLGAVGLGLLGAGALGYGAYEYGYGLPYSNPCSLATGNPYRCNDEFGY